MGNVVKSQGDDCGDDQEQAGSSLGAAEKDGRWDGKAEEEQVHETVQAVAIKPDNG